MITAKQIKMARVLLEWDQRKLAGAAGLSLPTIQRMEKLGPGKSAAANVERLQRALEDAGVEFTPDGGVRPAPRGGERGEGRR